MITGFIYEWVDLTTGLKYIGRHEGTIDDGYVASGTRFIAEYNSRPADFRRSILWFSNNTTPSEITSKEEEFLSAILDEELYWGENRKYYNQIRNANGYTSADNPMNNSEIVANMIKTRKQKQIPNAHQNTVAKYGEATLSKMKSVRMMGNKHATAHKGKTKSKKHKEKIANSIRLMYSNKQLSSTGNCNIGRPPTMRYEDTLKIYNDYGSRAGAEYLGISISAFKGRVQLAKKRLKVE